jgi:hypothetical protein
LRRQRGPDSDQRGGHRGVESDVEEERVRSVDSAVVGEAVGASSRWMRRWSGRPTWTRQWIGRQSTRRRQWRQSAMQKWMQSRSGRAGGGEMIVIRVRV